jgi:ketosteroid isomerase-like protein
MTPDDFISKYQAALRSQDWLAVEPLLHGRVCVTFSNGAVHRGVDAVGAAFKKNFSVIEGEDYRMSDLSWTYRTDDLAVCVFRFDWSGLIRGELASGSGRGTHVLVRDGDRWLLVVEHLGPG